MKFVRTVRSHEAITLPVGGKTYAVTSEPQEVSDEAATKIEEAAAAHGVTVQVSDERPETFRASTVGGSIAPDLSRGVGSISGHGAPVPTFDAAAATTDEAPADSPAELTGEPIQGGAVDTKTTTTKGK